MRRSVALLLVVSLASTAFAAGKLRFGPFKDELFAYPKILSASRDGNFVVVEFSAKRDVDGRDSASAKAERIALNVNEKVHDLVLSEGKVKVPFVEVGDISKPAKVAFIFVHGDQGNRLQGVADASFGGNFNRLKNLIVLNGGVYISPQLTNHRAEGTEQVKLLMAEFAKHSPGAPIFVGCSSTGGWLCWRLLTDATAVKLLSGVFLLGAAPGTDVMMSTKVKPRGRVPILIAHGSADTIVGESSARRIFERIARAQPGYPIRMVVFKGGKHGTPMRMIDWRAELNWALAAGGR